MPTNKEDIMQRLSDDIASDVGNLESNELKELNQSFYKILKDNIEDFNSSNFDKDGFIRRFSDFTTGNKNDSDMIKRILNEIKTDHAGINSINTNEILLKRDIFNICTQMPEMRDVIFTVRDSIIESDVVTGEIARSLIFQNSEAADNQTIVKELEKQFDLQKAIKNFIIPQTLMGGEFYVNIVPYSKLFAELDAYNRKLNAKSSTNRSKTSLTESTTKSIEYSIDNEENIKCIKESVSNDTIKIVSEYKDDGSSKIKDAKVDSADIDILLKNISVYPDGSTVLLQELGAPGLSTLLEKERDGVFKSNTDVSFFESVINGYDDYEKLEKDIEPGDIPYKKYNHIKGCYIKYLDPLRIIPVRIDRRVIGYCYASSKVNSKTNPIQPNGVVDVSIAHYTRDKQVVNSLAEIIIRSFDKKMLDNNIELKSEIADIVMSHKFAESRLSFVFIPENEVVRFIINEDENGKGHSIIEPSLFPARMYMLLTAYNMLYTLNNNTTRIHYLKSSGLNKDYASQVQRAMRKFQSRRITIDDIYSYSGVINKVGGMGEMVLPSGRGDYKAIETDTISAVDKPIDTEFLEQQRRQAISGTGVPALMVINALDDVDFAKTLELANTRYLSTVSSYKIDFNHSLTNMYKILMKYNSNIGDAEINSFLFKFNTIKQPTLNITNQMISDYNVLAELVSNIYFSQKELETEDGKPSNLAIVLKRKLAEEYLPQLDYGKMDTIAEAIRIEANQMTLKQQTKDKTISSEEIELIAKK
jgi:hypothetical protein